MDRHGTRRRGLELWLGTRARRLVLVALAVLGLTLLATNAAVTFAARSGFVLRYGDTFVRNFATVAVWGLLFEPLLWTCRALDRVTPRLWVKLLVHTGLSLVAAYGVGRLYEDVLKPRLASGMPIPAQSGEARPSEGARPPFGGGRERREPERGPGEREFGDRGPGERGPGERGTNDRGAGDRGPGDRAFGDRRTGPRDFGGLPPRPTGLFVYWALVGLCMGLDTSLKRRVEERERAGLALRTTELERALAEAQLANLRHQLHPHFLFNALHSIGGLVRHGEGEVAVETLSSLGGLLRAMLDKELRPCVPLSDELELIDAYLDIERQRLGERLVVATSLEAGVARAEVPTLVLLPLVENAVTYAVASRPEGGRIELSAARQGDRLVLEVCDDGPGFPPEVLAAGRGVAKDREPIGLANTRSRLAAMYGAAATLTLGARGSDAVGVGATGARVTLTLPFTVAGGSAAV